MPVKIKAAIKIKAAAEKIKAAVEKIKAPLPEKIKAPLPPKIKAFLDKLDNFSSLSDSAKAKIKADITDLLCEAFLVNEIFPLLEGSYYVVEMESYEELNLCYEEIMNNTDELEEENMHLRRIAAELKLENHKLSTNA